MRLLRRIAQIAGAVVILAASAEPAQAPTGAAVPVFDLSVRVHTDEPALTIEGQLTVPARNRSIEAVELDVDRRMVDLEISVVTPPGAAGSASLSRTRNAAVVTLGTPAPAGAPIALRFKYRIGASSGRSFYIAGDGVLLSGESVRWYPLPSNYRRATGRIRFILPQDMTIAATGRRGGGPGTDGSVQFEISDPTTFSFAAGRHRVYASAGEPAVALHLLTPRSRAGERLALVRRILAILIDEFGPYPHPDLEVVEMPNAAMGGAGNGTSLEGFVAVSTDVVDRASLLTLAHEVSHQWWVDSVAVPGPLLTEAMANYGALRVVEAIYGERAAAEVRWRGFPGEPPVTGGRGHLSLARAGMDGALTSPTIDGLVSGNKGMLVHDLLSRTLGRERFKTVLRTFTRDYAFQDTTWQAFVTAVRTADPSLDWFMGQWYERQGVPSWTVEWSQANGQARGVITQSPPYFRADVEVVMQGAGRRQVQLQRIEGPRTEFAWRPEFQVVSLVVDPDYKVPHDSPDRTADVDPLAPLGLAVKAARNGGSFIDAANAALREGPAQSQLSRDFLREVLLGGDAFDRGDWEQARRHFDTSLANAAPWPELLPGIYYSQAILARMRADRATLERSARAAIDADARLMVPTGWSIAARELLE